MSGPHITLAYEPFSMTLKDGNGLVLKEQFIDKSGKTRMLYASWVSKKFQNNVKRNVKRTSLFYNYNRTNSSLRLPIKQNKNKMKIYVDH